MTSKAVEMVADLMALSARTAPKGKGQDSIVIKVVTGDEVQKLAAEMHRLGETLGIKILLRDSGNMERSDACVVISCKGADVAGIDCGGCGFATCKEMLAAQESFASQKKPFHGPNCAIKMADLGIALGSAAKTASIQTSTTASCSLPE
jgi:uncharacterized ferredoxin-like protein